MKSIAVIMVGKFPPAERLTEHSSGRAARPRLKRVRQIKTIYYRGMVARGNTKTITVSFPVELAEQAEQLAKTESRTMSELFREAFRSYRAAAVRKRLVAGNAYAQSRAAQRYTEADVERLVDEARAELGVHRRKRR